MARYFAVIQNEQLAIRLLAYLLPLGVLPAMAGRVLFRLYKIPVRYGLRRAHQGQCHLVSTGWRPRLQVCDTGAGLGTEGSGGRRLRLWIEVALYLQRGRLLERLFLQHHLGYARERGQLGVGSRAKAGQQLFCFLSGYVGGRM